MFNEFKKGEYYEQTFQTLSFLTVIAILMTASGQAVQAGWEPGLPDQSLTTDHIQLLGDLQSIWRDGDLQICVVR